MLHAFILSFILSLLSLSLYMSIYIDRCIHVVAQWFQWIQRSFFNRLISLRRGECTNHAHSAETDSILLVPWTSDPIRYYLSISFLMKKQVANGHTSITNSYHGIEWAAQALCAVLRFQEAEARSDGVMASYTWHGCNVDCAQLRFGRIYDDLCTDLQTS